MNEDERRRWINNATYEQSINDSGSGWHKAIEAVRALLDRGEDQWA